VTIGFCPSYGRHCPVGGEETTKMLTDSNDSKEDGVRMRKLRSVLKKAMDNALKTLR
jgi:hypothetical protein